MRGEGEGGGEGVEIAKKNKNPTLRMWGNTMLESEARIFTQPLQSPIERPKYPVEG